MVQAPPRTVFNPQGTEHNDSNGSLVLITPQLSYYVEIRTEALITWFAQIYQCQDRNLIIKWLETRRKTGFYFEITRHLHLAFADQRDGAGTQYWWTIYYDSVEKQRIINAIKLQEHLVKTKLKNKLEQDDLLWNGLNFSSKTEIKIAKALSSQNITFFANVNGFVESKGLVVSNPDNKQLEKTEVDFLVFHNQKCMILEVDGKTHNKESRRNWDCKKDRIF